jgi:hypothetical protein
MNQQIKLMSTRIKISMGLDIILKHRTPMSKRGIMTSITNKQVTPNLIMLIDAIVESHSVVKHTSNSTHKRR